MEVDEDSVSSLVGRIRFLQNCKQVLTKKDKRTVRIVASFLEEKLVHKVVARIRANPRRPWLGVYASDGWSAQVAVGTVADLAEHCRVDHRGRVKHEFCLERAMFREKLGDGGDRLMVVLKRPRGLAKGKRHGNFFQAAVDFVPTLTELGARGVRMQLFNLDGLHYASFMRLMRGRFALRYKDPDSFADEESQLRRPRLG